MANIINFSIIDIEGYGVVESIVSMELEDGDDGTEAVHTLAPGASATGYRGGVQTVSGTFEALRFSPKEIDWHAWKFNSEERLIQYEERVKKGDSTPGERYHLQKVRVTGISKSRAANAATDSISWIALLHRPAKR